MNMKFDIFSPFYWKVSMPEHNDVKDYILPKIKDHRTKGLNSPDWYVDTSYDMGFDFDWWPCIEAYKKHVNDFHNNMFKTYPDWEIVGDPWYTAYDKNQIAQIHDHMPDDFSVLHILKYDKELHSPVVFVHPDIKLMRSNYSKGKASEYLKESVLKDTDNSYFHNWHYPTIEEGDILIWPSTLDHFVPKNMSDELRITIAFNYNIK